MLGDQLGHEALRQPEVVAEVVRRWGREVLEADGTVSRRSMGALPAAGQWVKLSVPASQVGLEGSTLWNGGESTTPRTSHCRMSSPRVITKRRRWSGMFLNGCPKSSEH